MVRAMPPLLPNDIEAAVRRICRKNGIAFTGIDWKRVYDRRAELTEEDYWALSVFCRENGEYRRGDKDGPIEPDENGRYEWVPGEGDYTQLRHLLREMGLIKDEGRSEDAG